MLGSDTFFSIFTNNWIRQQSPNNYADAKALSNLCALNTEPTTLVRLILASATSTGSSPTSACSSVAPGSASAMVNPNRCKSSLRTRAAEALLWLCISGFLPCDCLWCWSKLPGESTATGRKQLTAALLAGWLGSIHWTLNT